MSMSGKIYHYDGNSWTLMETLSAGIQSIWGTSSTNIYAVGSESGQPAIFHYNGSEWSEMESGTSGELRNIHGNSADKIYASASNGSIYYYNGISWSQIKTGAPSSIGLYAINCSENNHVFAAGQYGTILHYQPELFISIPLQAVENDGTLSNQGLVSIEYPRESDLSVSLTSSHSKLVCTSPLVIPAGETSKQFNLEIQDNLFKDGTTPITVTASADDYSNGTAKIVIYDNETETLTVSMPDSITEGQGKVSGLASVSVASTASVDIFVPLQTSDTSEILVPDSVIILSGQTSQAFDFTVVSDMIIDGSQTAIISATISGWNSVPDAITVVDLVDKSITVTLPERGIEGDGVLAEKGIVTLASVQPNDVTLTITNSDASQVSVTTTVVIPKGWLSAGFDIEIIDDATTDGAVPVSLTITGAGWSDGNNSLSVQDNEKGVVQFSSDLFTTTEDAGVITITITRTYATDGSVTVDYATTDGTATSGSDYIPVSGTIVMNDSQSSQSFTVTINDDTDIEGIETIIVTLSNPGNGVSIGIPNPATISITEVNYMTEQFDASDFDLENTTLIFTPDGSESYYEISQQSATSFPVDPTGSTQLSIGNWSYLEVNGLTASESFSITVNAIDDPPQISQIISVASGSGHHLALKADGTVYGWGKNDYGQLGNGNTTEQHTPVPVQGLTNVKAVFAGNDHSMALKHDGTLWAWGYNAYGQLGDGSTEDRHTPVQVSGINAVVDVSLGVIHSLAVKADKTAWAWGRNSFGRLGIDAGADQLVPAQIKGVNGTGLLSNIIQVAAGDMHSMALGTNGNIFAWGNNDYNQLGNGVSGSGGSKSYPAPITSLSNVKEIGVGIYHSAALKHDGSVWTWGKKEWLGAGSLTVNQNLPVQVLDESGTGHISSVVDIAIGEEHNLAILSDGTVWGWGRNGAGRLGDGTTTDHNTPIQVEDSDGTTKLSNILSFDGGTNNTIIAKPDGTIWTCGNNVNGRIGDNTTTERHNITQVHGQRNIDYLNANVVNQNQVTKSIHLIVSDPDADNVTLTAISSDNSILPYTAIELCDSGANTCMLTTTALRSSNIPIEITTTTASGMITITIQATDSTGLTTSYAMPLRVNSAPTITGLEDLSIMTNSSDAIAFTISDNETSDLVLTRESSDLSLVSLENIVISGTGVSRTLTITPTSNQSGTASITISVFDGDIRVFEIFEINVQAVYTVDESNSLSAVSKSASHSVILITMAISTSC
ncbi:MAG: hypothetical protein OMM_04345 [Candidatus Magnetoglobus multicellularis str. Araruama]|uniref:Calx-beta domain-containing protein n=1 Tax=Candidatus Magnetoglobus multicellularis str. Araruama TaxID=890399 RepID=A0A1V1P1X3_9BACT|nr:MAG: hypothetical protein OMM_04345 [Candidatus Magnetoglobus multicellularis str. Araruama]